MNTVVSKPIRQEEHEGHLKSSQYEERLFFRARKRSAMMRTNLLKRDSCQSQHVEDKGEALVSFKFILLLKIINIMFVILR